MYWSLDDAIIRGREEERKREKVSVAWHVFLSKKVEHIENFEYHLCSEKLAFISAHTFLTNSNSSLKMKTKIILGQIGHWS